MLCTSIASLLVDFKTISLIKTFQLNYMNRFIRRTSTLQELIWLHPSCSLSLSPLFHRPFFLHNFLLFTHNPSYLWLFLPPLLLPLLPLFFIIIFMFFVFFQFFALFLFLRILFLTSYLFSLPLLFRLLFLLLSVVFSSSSCLFAFFYLSFCPLCSSSNRFISLHIPFNMDEFPPSGNSLLFHCFIRCTY